MELEEAERAAIREGRQISRASMEMANVGKPRDPIEEWEFRVRCQFEGLYRETQKCGCALSREDLPPKMLGASPGQEVEVFYDPVTDRVWKATYPNQSGKGPTGFFTVAGYLRRLRLSNLIFADDVRFEGVISNKEGISIVTSQHYVMPHPERFIPTQQEIETCMKSYGFEEETPTTWIRKDGISCGDVHDRNLMIAPDGSIEVIDVQPILQSGFDWDDVIRACSK